MEETEIKVAIVGSGPAGFYAAGALLKSELVVSVDIFESLPVPFGLVRSGVAPDHEKIKSVTRQFEKIAELERCSFFGNVEVGRDISVEELGSYYHAVILAHGAGSDRSLGIRGEALTNSRTATEFVAWYNGHPGYSEQLFDLSAKSVAIIGQGNVAVDVARILVKQSAELEKTDMADYAVDALSEAETKDVYIIGRRGPLQAAFSDKELKELGELADCNVIVKSEDLELGLVSRAELNAASKVVRNNFAILEEFSAREPDESLGRNLHILFFRSPLEVIGAEKVEGLKLAVTKLEGDIGSRRAVPTGKSETLTVQSVFRSVGYRGLGLPDVPFDETKGVYPNIKGRVLQEDRAVLGLYTAGWIKRGPSGVIGTNKPDSVETVSCILEDAAKLLAEKHSLKDKADLRSLLSRRGVRVVSYEDWKRIDAHEVSKGAILGKTRLKLVRLADVLKVLDT